MYSKRPAQRARHRQRPIWVENGWETIYVFDTTIMTQLRVVWLVGHRMFGCRRRIVKCGSQLHTGTDRVERSGSMDGGPGARYRFYPAAERHSQTVAYITSASICTHTHCARSHTRTCVIYTYFKVSVTHCGTHSCRCVAVMCADRKCDTFVQIIIGKTYSASQLLRRRLP